MKYLLLFLICFSALSEEIIFEEPEQENPMGYYLPMVEVYESPLEALQEKECLVKVMNYLRDAGIEEAVYEFDDGIFIHYPGADCYGLITLWGRIYEAKTRLE